MKYVVRGDGQIRKRPNARGGALPIEAVDVTSTPGATTPLDAPPGQAQVMLLRDALAARAHAGTPSSCRRLPATPPPSLEQGKGAAFDAYA